MANQAPQEVTIQQMRQNIISDRTFEGYKGEIWRTQMHGHDNIPLQWLTGTARDKITLIKHNIELARGRQAKAKAKWDGVQDMLGNCHESPIFRIDKVTPESYMTFLQSQRGEGGAFLKASNCQGKTSALFHLFRCHADLEGCPDGFEDRLKTLKTGFL